MKINLSQLLQKNFIGFPFQYLPYSISRKLIYLMGILYFLINWKEMKLILNLLKRNNYKVNYRFSNE